MRKPAHPFGSSNQPTIPSRKAPSKGLTWWELWEAAVKTENQLRPEPGSRDSKSTNPKGRAFRNEAPVKGPVSVAIATKTQRILSPPPHSPFSQKSASFQVFSQFPLFDL